MQRQLRKIGSHGESGGDLLHRRLMIARLSIPVGKFILRCPSRMAGVPAQRVEGMRVTSVSPTEMSSVSLWSGSDEFTCYNDRIDAPPLPLPSISEPVRIVIVRHGQSTWNAEGRIQGSTDLSVLTEKGIKQAERTRDMLSSMHFSRVFQSPLTRARQTADVVMQGQPGAVVHTGEGQQKGGSGAEGGQRMTLPSLREIDLYQFQGLLKHEGKAVYGDQYKKWQKTPHAFELDGRAPVRELWHRASLAWQSLLQPPPPQQQQQQQPGQDVTLAAHRGTATDPRIILVAAHNAINQALVATALRLPPSYFRRLPQNNAALSIFDLEPSSNSSSDGGAPRVTLSCLNQSPDNPFKNPDEVVANVVLVTPSVLRPLTHGSSPLKKGAAEALAAGELRSLATVLGKLKVTHVLAGPGASSETVAALLEGQQLPQPGTFSPIASAEEQQWLPAEDGSVTATTAAAFTSTDAAAARTADSLGVAVEFLHSSEPADAIWDRAVSLAACAATQAGSSRQSYGNVCVVVDGEVHVGILWAALGVEASDAGTKLRVSAGGLSVIEFSADPRVTPATVRCINNTAHVSRPNN